MLPLDYPDASGQTGFLFFRLLARLKTQPDGDKHCVADYSSERIVFHIEDEPKDVVALVSPPFPFPCICVVDPDKYPVL
jgi:hypothetical protein